MGNIDSVIGGRLARVALAFSILLLCLAGSSTASAAELVATERAGFFPDEVTVGQGTELPFELNLIATGTIGCLTTRNSPVTGQVATHYTIAADGKVDAERLSSGFPFFSNGQGRLLPLLNCGVTWSGAPAPYRVPADVTVAPGTPPGRYKTRIPATVRNSGLAGIGPLRDGQADEITFVVTAPLPPPRVDNSFNVAPLSGTAKIKLPGQQQFQPLTEPLHLGVSAVVDASGASIMLSADRDGSGTVQTAELGGDLFTPRYRRDSVTAAQGGSRNLVTDLKLPDATGCPVKGRRLRASAAGTTRARTARRRRPKFRIKKKGGRFRSSNRDVQGAGIGTEWTTQGSCDGTLVGVQSGSVRVTDRRLRRRFLVPLRQAFLVARPGTVEARAKGATARRIKGRGLIRFAGRTSKGQPASVRVTRGFGAVRRLAVQRDLECRRGNVRSVRRGTLQLGTFRFRPGRVFAGARRLRPALDSQVRSGRVAVNGRLIGGGSTIRGALSERLTLRDGTRCRSGPVRFRLGRS